MVDLSGSTAIVTGAGTGIGRAVARALVGAGCRVDLWGRRLEQLEEAALNLDPERVRITRCDVSERVRVDAAVAALQSAWGRVDLLVNNAGINRFTTKIICN